MISTVALISYLYHRGKSGQTNGIFLRRNRDQKIPTTNNDDMMIRSPKELLFGTSNNSNEAK